MDTLFKRCTGLDVHSESIVACVLLGESETDLVKETETFPTLTKDLFRLLKWLEEKEVTHIAMKAQEFIGSPFILFWRISLISLWQMPSESKTYLAEKRMFRMQSGC